MKQSPEYKEGYSAGYRAGRKKIAAKERAEWIMDKSGWYCSKCKTKHNQGHENYCCKCGAKMKGC